MSTCNYNGKLVKPYESVRMSPIEAGKIADELKTYARTTYTQTRILFWGIDDKVLYEYLKEMMRTYFYGIPIENTREPVKAATDSKLLTDGKFLDKYGKVSSCLWNEWKNKLIYSIMELERREPDGSLMDSFSKGVCSNKDAEFLANYLIYKVIT